MRVVQWENLSSQLENSHQQLHSQPKNPQALNVAVNYLQDTANEWWIGCKEIEDGRQVSTLLKLGESLIGRFEALNKFKIARDKLARWKQIKDVPSFNEDFQKILLIISTITVEEQLDRYARGLKTYS